MSQLVKAVSITELQLAIVAITGHNTKEVSFVEYLKGIIQNLRDCYPRTFMYQFTDLFYRVFETVLEGKGGIRLGMVRDGEENIFAEIDDYVYLYIPDDSKNPSPQGFQPEFLPIQPNDVVLGRVTDEEMGMFLHSVWTGLEVVKYKEAYEGPDSEYWHIPMAIGLTPIAHFYWILFWSSIIWRFPEVHGKLKIGEVDLELREDWQIVICRPSRLSAR